MGLRSGQPPGLQQWGHSWVQSSTDHRRGIRSRSANAGCGIISGPQPKGSSATVGQPNLRSAPRVPRRTNGDRPARRKNSFATKYKGLSGRSAVPCSPTVNLMSGKVLACTSRSGRDPHQGGICAASASRDFTRGPQHICHQGATARGLALQSKRLWCTLGDPALRRHQGQQLSEHLNDFGGGVKSPCAKGHGCVIPLRWVHASRWPCIRRPHRSLDAMRV